MAFLVANSTLTAVLRAAKATLRQATAPTPTSNDGAGMALPIMVGKHYKEFGAGSAPRILLVPDARGKAGPPIEIGGHEIGSRLHRCDVYVRGAERGAGDDEGRYEAAYLLSDKLQNALQAVAGARVVFGAAEETAEAVDVDAYGADDAWSFVYLRAVYRDDAIQEGARAAVASLSPADPDRLHGGNGLTPIIDVTTTNARP